MFVSVREKGASRWISYPFRYLTTAQRNARSVTLDRLPRGRTLLRNRAHQVMIRFEYDAGTDPTAAPGETVRLMSAQVVKEATPRFAPPAAPGNVRLVPGDGKFSVFWDAPAHWGNGEPGGYEVVAYGQGLGDGSGICSSGYPRYSAFPVGDCQHWFPVFAPLHPTTKGLILRRVVRNHDIKLANNGVLQRVVVLAWNKRPGTDGTGVGDFAYGPRSAEATGTPMAGLADGPSGVTLSIDDADRRVGEDAGALTVTATLNAPTSNTVALTLSIDGASTATEGANADFTLSPKTITIAAGNTTGTATLTVRDDTEVETNEVVVIRAVGSVNTQVNATLNVTIVDNDEAIGAPTGLQVTPGAAQLALSWTAPASGTVTGYDVHYKESAAPNSAATGGGTDPATGWVDAAHGGTTTARTISGLTNGRGYDVRVRAKAAGGNSAWLLGSGTPAAASLGTPANFALTPGDGTIAASWDAVANADGYVLRHGVAGSGTAQSVALGAVLSHTVTGLVNGTDYTVSVQAVDSTGTYGAGPPTPWRTATPAAAASSDAGLFSLAAAGGGGAAGPKAVHSTNVLIQRLILAGVKGSDCFCYLIDGNTLSAFGTRVGTGGVRPPPLRA